MRYQTKLLIAFGGLLALALSGAWLTYWGAERSRYHLERSRLAHDVLGEHQQLAVHTYELFKQLADRLLIGERDAGNAARGLRRALEADLGRLRDLIASEVAFVEGGEAQEEKAELARLALIERQIARVLREFDEVANLREEGRSGDAWAKLTAVLQESIDADFNTLIAAAIAEEQREVAASDAAAEQLLGRLELATNLQAALAVIFAVGTIVTLIRGLQRPLARLLQGTEALARGDLGHRLAISGDDEFARLARAFDRMAADLEDQRQQLQTAQAGLEHAVTARTEELRRANQALERAARNRCRFFADISHELRTPLTIIRGEGEITLRGKDKTVEEYKNALRRVVEQAEHTGRLVDDLLFIARQDEGEVRIAFQVVALAELVGRVCEDMRALAEERSVAVTCTNSVSGAVVSGDPARLRQLFLILLDNAVRYSRGPGTVTITLSPSMEGVVVRLADSGIGIPAEELERVFDRFYRSDNAAEHDREGTGLGLSVAKAIVDAHGGAIEIASSRDQGTVVTVTLPTIRKLRAVA